MGHNRIKINSPGVIELVEGRKRVKLNSESYYRRNLDQFQIGEKVSVSIDNERVTASEQQRRYLFGVVYKVIGDHCGYSTDEVHDAMMKLYPEFKTKTLKIGGKKIEVRESWTRLSKGDGVGYIEWLLRFAAEELKLYIPRPQDAGYISNYAAPVKRSLNKKHI